jgi:hypothetical protein
VSGNVSIPVLSRIDHMGCGVERVVDRLVVEVGESLDVALQSSVEGQIGDVEALRVLPFEGVPHKLLKVLDAVTRVDTT